MQHPAYGALDQRFVVRGEDSVDGTVYVEVALAPAAMPLEGLVVEVDAARTRLERRRNAHGFGCEALDIDAAFPRGRLPQRLSDHLAIEAGYPLRECPGSTMTEYNCYPYRGRVRAIRVCLDEGPLHGGVAALEAIPQAAIARMEFFPGSGLMKVYTRRFMEQASARPWLISGIADHC